MSFFMQSYIKGTPNNVVVYNCEESNYSILSFKDNKVKYYPDTAFCEFFILKPFQLEYKPENHGTIPYLICITLDMPGTQFHLIIVKSHQ